MQHHESGRDPPAAPAHLGRVPLGIAPQLPPVVIEGAIGVVQQGGPQPPHCAFQGDLLVDLALQVPPAIFPEEPQHPVVLPPGVANLVSEEEAPALDFVSIMRPAGEGAADLCGQLRRHPLIGVHRQHPLAAGVGGRPVLLGGGRQILVLQDARPALPRQVGRAIGAEGIHDDDLVGEAERLQAVADVAGLVVGGHDGGQPGHLDLLSSTSS